MVSFSEVEEQGEGVEDMRDVVVIVGGREFTTAFDRLNDIASLVNARQASRA